ncbi:MAG: glucose 1-dehydrogenase [Candidatus Tectomicrobia bacterium]|nr:glucose 1-dehydrogenase [Candidatus Tectomicrobia bacterium]
MGRLDGKVAVITGAARGQGVAEAELFEGEGARVVLTDVLVDEGEKAAERIRTAGGEALFVRLDVSSPEEWNEVVRHTVQTYGRLDILVNNAGIPTRGGVESTPLEDWDRCMDINAKGVFLGMKYAIPAMLENQSGSVINISSTSGIVGYPGGTAYHASKGAVRIMSKAAALEYARRGVRVNSLHPGFIKTAMTDSMDEERAAGIIDRTPIGRKGTPMEIAYGALFLASDESSFVTGAELVIDGGMTAA